MNDVLVLEDLLTLTMLLYGIHRADANIIGELTRRSVRNYENTVQLLRYNNHICNVSNINAVFLSFRCPICKTFFTR